MNTTDRPITNMNVLRGLVLCLVLYIMWAVITKLIIPELLPGLTPSSLIFISRILFWLYVLAVWLFAVKVEKNPLLLWPENKIKLLTAVVSVLLILLIVIVGSGIFSALIKYIGLHQESSALKSLYSSSIPLKLFVVVTAAITEELIFRGYLIPRLQLFFKGKWLPVVISALIFGLAHLSYGTWINLLVPVLVGLVFGWYYQKYCNIKILMICHFIIDLSALLLLKS